MKRGWLVVLLATIVIFAILVATQALSASLEVQAMGTPGANGVPSSYLADIRYHCDQLGIARVNSSLLGLDFEVPGDLLESSGMYFDQRCRVTGQTGTLPVFFDEGRGQIYMDASVISGVARYDYLGVASPSTGVLNVKFKSIPSLGYRALSFSGYEDGFQIHSLSFNPSRVTGYIWIQMRDTDDLGELRDESTWHLLPLIELYSQDYVLLPSGQIVELTVTCDVSGDGHYDQGVAYCGSELAAQHFGSQILFQRYGGIIMGAEK